MPICDLNALSLKIPVSVEPNNLFELEQIFQKAQFKDSKERFSTIFVHLFQLFIIFAIKKLHLISSLNFAKFNVSSPFLPH